jgi:L-glyceraldehyde 3-phosphate reductase
MADITKIDTFIQNSPHPAWLATTQGHCVYANPALERLTGFNSDQVNQADWRSFLLEEDRWVEKDLLATLEELGMGCIAFSPLAQGLLTNKYLNGVPANSRANADGSFQKEFLSEGNLARVRALNEIAKERGQSLAQMAIAWVLRDRRITSALIGARNVEQLDNSLDAVKKLQFTDAELSEIDRYAQDGSIDFWKNAREGAA